VLVAWNYQESGPAERFETSHFIVVQRDRTEHREPRAFELYHGHAPRQVHQWHVDFADDGHDVLVDLGEPPVRQDFPVLKWFAHGLRSLAGADAATIRLTWKRMPNN